MKRILAGFYLIIFFTGISAQGKRYILDADTGNEMDDLYAITGALASGKAELLGITSAHFNNVQLLTDSMWHIYPTQNINTLKISQNLNEEILGRLGRNDIPLPEGCDRMVGYAWGYYEGAPVPTSPAVDFIIEEARKTPAGEKLNIIILGPVTNVAAAVLKDPAIIERIRVYALTMRYDPELNAWNKNSFNARNDINGLDVLLNSRALEMYVIPGNVSSRMIFYREETLKKLKGMSHPLAEMLTERWDEVSAGNTWIMWDVALVEAFLNPQFAVIETLEGPPENGYRPLNVYVDIEVKEMQSHFWKKMESLMVGN